MAYELSWGKDTLLLVQKKNSNKQETNATVHLFVCNIFFKNSFIPQRLVYFDNCFKIIHSSVKREVTTQLKITFGTI